MPPRLPVVFAFVLTYLAVAFSVGFEALDAVWRVDAPAWLDGALNAVLLGAAEALGRAAPEAAGRTFAITLTTADGLALLAAIAALPDAALRRPRALSDRALSLLALLATVAPLAIAPALLTPGYAILCALMLGDAVAAMGGWRSERRL